MTNEERQNKLDKLINVELTKQYVEAMRNTTRAVEEFHLMAILNIVSSMMMRRVYMQQGTSFIYSNLYSLVVAPSSRAKKSTATDNYVYWIERLGLAKYLLGDIMTIEGLGAFMMDGDEDEDGTCNKQKGVAFVHYDEFGSLLATVKKKYANGILDDLNQIYSCGRLTKSFKTTPIRVDETFMNIIGATQLHSLEKYTDEFALLSGFFPRFLICYETHINSHIANRPEPLSEQFNYVKDVLDMIKQHIHDIGERNARKLYLDNEASELFERWSFRNDEKAANEPNFIQTMMGRTDTLFFKIAMVLHIMQEQFDNDYISKDTAFKSMCIVNWHISNYKKLIIGTDDTQGLAFDENKRKYNDLYDLIKSKKKLTRSDIKRQKGWDYRTIDEIMHSLWQSYIIDRELGPRDGHIYEYIPKEQRDIRREQENREGEEGE